jgi:hypothetical protein
MPIQLSDETKVEQNPKKFAIADGSDNLVTFINNEPPTGIRGRRSNPVINRIYSELMAKRGIWAHVNIQITNKKQRMSIVAALYNRAKKDGLYLSTRSMFNDVTKTYELWVMLTNN